MLDYLGNKTPPHPGEAGIQSSSARADKQLHTDVPPTEYWENNMDKHMCGQNHDKNAKKSPYHYYLIEFSSYFSGSSAQ
jgi:hypothetical protein